MIRKATDKDAASIASIYNYYIEKTAVTFEENAIDEMEVVKRLNLAQELDWWVYDHQDQIKAYAYASYWKPRSAYRYTLETSVYVHPENRKNGIGVKLYSHLIAELRKKKYRTLLAGITLPNEGSVHFHEKMGFRKVGQLEKVGFKFNQWLDVGYWELNL